jgi:spermidine/putrescine ABC transporter ATP-binding subunit
VSALLGIRNVAKGFGNRAVLRGITLDVASGEFLTILGESGSGKTTLLRLIAGFERPDNGEIWMEEERIDSRPPYRRHVNTVFQSYALFPHLSVFENIAYGLRVQGAAKTEIPQRVQQALAMVKMSDFAQSAPARLSGGQQQRVALARALVNRPKVLLLDEPLSALDANLRRQMQIELKSLQREVGITFIFVTHDQEEAMALSDRIALLRAGNLEQVAEPREIYARPATAYTAQFIGQTNLLRAELRNGLASSSGIIWRAVDAAVPAAPTSPLHAQPPVGAGLAPPSDDLTPKSTLQSTASEKSATFSLRPECIRLAETSSTNANAVRFTARITNQTFGGATDLLEVTLSDGRKLRVRIPSQGILDGPQQFEFAPQDAIRVKDSEPT